MRKLLITFLLFINGCSIIPNPIDNAGSKVLVGGLHIWNGGVTFATGVINLTTCVISLCNIPSIDATPIKVSQYTLDNIWYKYEEKDLRKSGIETEYQDDEYTSLFQLQMQEENAKNNILFF